jgi:phage terminase Nu1 subunit (DNA packaging protein)
MVESDDEGDEVNALAHTLSEHRLTQAAGADTLEMVADAASATSLTFAINAVLWGSLALNIEEIYESILESGVTVDGLVSCTDIDTVLESSPDHHPYESGWMWVPPS